MIDVNHGTYTAYGRFGCRCDECKEYQRERVERNRRDRLKNGRLSHGTRSAYDAGCRCGDCKDIRSKKSKIESLSTKHNHVTRDIKPPGECSGCDLYHDKIALTTVGTT